MSLENGKWSSPWRPRKVVRPREWRGWQETKWSRPQCGHSCCRTTDTKCQPTTHAMVQAAEDRKFLWQQEISKQKEKQRWCLSAWRGGSDASQMLLRECECAADSHNVPFPVCYETGGHPQWSTANHLIHSKTDEKYFKIGEESLFSFKTRGNWWCALFKNGDSPLVSLFVVKFE